MIVTARLPNGQVLILGVRPDRDKVPVKRLLLSIPARLGESIERLCTDLYEGDIQTAREALPQVRRVIDRFHVAQQYRNAADRVRQQELKRLKRDLLKADYQPLQGSLQACRKNQADLSPDEPAVLTRRFGYSIEIAAAHLLREELTAIVDQVQSQTQAQEQLQAWQARVRHSGLTCFDAFRNTPDHCWAEITNYFSSVPTHFS